MKNAIIHLTDSFLTDVHQGSTSIATDLLANAWKILGFEDEQFRHSMLVEPTDDEEIVEKMAVQHFCDFAKDHDRFPLPHPCTVADWFRSQFPLEERAFLETEVAPYLAAAALHIAITLYQGV